MKIKTKIKIVVSKIKGCSDSFFYDGEIATITKPNGTILSLIATGDIRINFKDDNNSYRNRNIQEAITKYKLTDKKLRILEKKGILTWENNNWFEVTWLKKGSEWDWDIGEVVYDYDEAIQLLLLNYYNNKRY